MKIVLILSGYSGIYPYFERSIEDIFLQLNFTITKVNPEYNQETVEVINKMNPDIIMTLVGYKMDRKLIEFLKKKESLLCIWLTEDPFYSDNSMEIIEDFHFIFTIDFGSFEFYKKIFPNKNVYHLPLGTDPSLYYPSDPQKVILYDLCLVGYPYPERIELVHHIIKHTTYTIILVGPLWRRYIRRKANCNRLEIINKWMEPSYVREIFNMSKIILNPHRAHDFFKNKNTLGIESKSINNRTFDISACGGFQLISNKLDLEKHFNISSEIVSFSNKDDCINLINDFMNDEKRRNDYSKNANERVLNNHTFFHRIQFILDKIDA
jgi:spore maturation protein CgeB